MGTVIVRAKLPILWFKCVWDDRGIFGKVWGNKDGVKGWEFRIRRIGKLTFE